MALTQEQEYQWGQMVMKHEKSIYRAPIHVNFGGYDEHAGIFPQRTETSLVLVQSILDFPEDVSFNVPDVSKKNPKSTTVYAMMKKLEYAGVLKLSGRGRGNANRYIVSVEGRETMNKYLNAATSGAMETKAGHND